MKALVKYLKDFWLKKDLDQNNKIQNIISYIIPILILFFIFFHGLVWVSRLKISAYFNASIAFELLKELWSTFLIIPLLILLFIYRKRLTSPWSSFQEGKRLRIVIFIITLILAWYYSTYSYNYYFNQSHLIDRVVLIILAITVYWRPIFILPFLLLLLSIAHQFNSLMSYSSGISPFLLIKILTLFLAFLSYKLLFNKFQFSAFIFLFFCLIGGHYFTPGFGKLNQEWVLHDHINYLIAATYSNGWLSFLEQSTISKLISFLDAFNTPLRIFTLVVECGTLFYFYHLKYIRISLVLALIMHLGIFLYSGILFWMWILLILIARCFLLKKDLPINTIFNKYYFITGLIFISTARLWAAAGALSWNDTALSYTYKIQAKTNTGDLLDLPPNFFSSYDYQFTTSNFKFLIEDKRLPIVWGATNQSTSRYFNNSRSKKDILEYEKANGRTYKNNLDKQAFIAFIKSFIKHRNEKITHRNISGKFIQAPSLYWTFPYYSSFDIKTTIKSISVIEITSYYTKENGYEVIRDLEILKLDID